MSKANRKLVEGYSGGIRIYVTEGREQPYTVECRGKIYYFCATLEAARKYSRAI